MEGYPDYRISGGIDWFEWWALVHWENPDRFSRAAQLFQKAKTDCQKLCTGRFEVHLPDFGPVKVKRVGFNRGGDRGQHYEYQLKIPGVTIGLAPRDFPPTISQRDRQRVMPNFVAKQTGRDCLLFGALDGFEMADALITALGGRPIVKRLSRGDLCLDVVNLDVQELLQLAQAGHFVTRASIVEPKRNLVTDEVNGFYAGKFPQYMTVYDKPREQRGKTDALYLQALIDRRWGGNIPKRAARVEFQLARRWLREQGVDSPEDFLSLRGKLSEKLTHDFFRLTETPVDRRNKHQSRAKTHPLWSGVQGGFEAIFGPPEGVLAPLQRQKVRPIELARQGRGCLANCLLQMGAEFKTYRGFANASQHVLLNMFSEEDKTVFMQEIADRRMEYEVS